MTNRNRLFKRNGPAYDSNPFTQVPLKKVAPTPRPDQLPGPVTVITPAVASTREDEDAHLRTTHDCGDLYDAPDPPRSRPYP